MLNVKRVQAMAARRLKSEDANQITERTGDHEDLAEREVGVTPERRPYNERPREPLPAL